jgi:capsular polysaccharide transport system permease protein
MAARFGNKPGGYVWALLDPVAHIAFLSVIFMAIARAPALGSSFALFFASGYIAFQFFQSASGYVGAAVTANKTLLNYPNVAPIDAVLARALLQYLTTAVVAVIVLSMILLTVSMRVDFDWLLLLHASLLAATMALGVGLANNVLFRRFPFYEQIFGIVTRPLFLISGVFFLPDALPHPIRELVLLNPLAHIIILFRIGIYPEYRGIGLDMSFVQWCVFCMLFLGLTVFTFGRRVLRGND